ncbi:hypothetical protein GCM10011362_18610 [Marinobacter halophilus]|nr:hypothetical protein GCM10011362_18610 [Marinobacter halophilus]
MHIYLTEQHMGEQTQPIVKQGNAGFITGGFDTKNQHKQGRVQKGSLKADGILAETGKALADSLNSH